MRSFSERAEINKLTSLYHKSFFPLGRARTGWRCQLRTFCAINQSRFFLRCFSLTLNRWMPPKKEPQHPIQLPRCSLPAVAVLLLLFVFIPKISNCFPSPYPSSLYLASSSSSLSSRVVANHRDTAAACLLQLVGLVGALPGLPTNPNHNLRFT